MALKNHINFNYLHIVTGQDCLCRSVEEFNDFFSADNSRNYMSISSAKSENRFRYRTFYRNDWLNYKNRWGKLATKVCYIMQRLIGINRKPPCGYQIYKGMVYVSITKEFGQYVIEYINTEEGKKYIKWLKWCFLPDHYNEFEVQRYS